MVGAWQAFAAAGSSKLLLPRTVLLHCHYHTRGVAVRMALDTHVYAAAADVVLRTSQPLSVSDRPAKPHAPVQKSREDKARLKTI